MRAWLFAIARNRTPSSWFDARNPWIVFAGTYARNVGDTPAYAVPLALLGVDREVEVREDIFVRARVAKAQVLHRDGGSVELLGLLELVGRHLHATLGRRVLQGVSPSGTVVRRLIDKHTDSQHTYQ